MPSRCGTCPMIVTQTSPSMNPRITGVGMKAATQPMRSAPKSRKKRTDQNGEGGGERIELGRALRRDGAHGQGGDQAGGGVRTDDQQARGAEQRVGNQRRNDGVEPHDRAARRRCRHRPCPPVP